VSKHLKVLERAGLIVRGREAQWRPCRIEPTALKQVDDWLERYRRLWVERLDRLEEYLREVQAKEKKRGRKKKPRAEAGPAGAHQHARIRGAARAGAGGVDSN